MSDAKTSRFDRKRAEIIAAATTLINERGAHAITMRDVADAVNLQPATLAYYFKSRDHLAAAVFELRLSALEQMIRQAGRVPTPPARVRMLIAQELRQLSGVIEGSLTPLSSLVSSSDGPEFDFVRHRISDLFAQMGGLLQPADRTLSEDELRPRLSTLIGLLFFMPLWVPQYPISEFARVEERAMDLLIHGMALPGRKWQPQILPVDTARVSTGAGNSRQDFLRAATRILNVHGYAAASVDRIAEELEVTKGSFYHHFASKDELITRCVSSNFHRMSVAISNAIAAGGPCDQRIASAFATLLDLQFGNDWKLLRSVALASLPMTMRHEVAIRSNGIALRFAGLVFDGMVEGTVRAVDPLITGHAINSAIYGTFNLLDWAAGIERPRAIEIHASTLWRGMFD